MDGINWWFKTNESIRVHIRLFQCWVRTDGVDSFALLTVYLTQHRPSKFLNFGITIFNFGIELVCYEDKSEGNAPVPGESITDFCAGKDPVDAKKST